ncbi:MAG: hypothetical protein ACI4CS_10335 [Candidatus Weimeria sp.]
MTALLLSAVMIITTAVALPGTVAKADTVTSNGQFNTSLSVHVTLGGSRYSFYATDDGYGNVTFSKAIARDGTPVNIKTKKGKSIKKFYFTVQPYVSDPFGGKHYGTTSAVKAQSFKIN